MAGWASNNKYALFGAMRSAAQIVSYEIPSLLIILVPVMIVGSLSLQDLTLAQQGGLQNWFLFRYFPIMPVAFVSSSWRRSPRPTARPSTSPRPRASSWPASTPSTAASSSRCSSWPSTPRCSWCRRSISVLFLGGYLAPLPAAAAGRAAGDGLVLAVVQGLVPDVRDDVAALDAAALARRPADVHRLEGAAADRARAGGAGGRARPGSRDGERLPVGPLRRLAAHAAAGGLPDARDDSRAAWDKRRARELAYAGGAAAAGQVAR